MSDFSSDDRLRKAKASTVLLADIWQVQSEWMRKNGVVSAKWEGERLVECIMGPATEPATQPESAEEMKVRHEREAKERKELEDLRDFGAS